jgi:hypothetical protein
MRAERYEMWGIYFICVKISKDNTILDNFTKLNMGTK